jgi:glycerate kinase
MLKKIVIAPDSFKGTMSSVEVCNIIEEGIKNICPDICTVKVPIADGGEGTVEAFLTAMPGKKVYASVKGPYFEDIDACYGILDSGTTAIIEMAAASGLHLVGRNMNPSATTTFGTGQLIKDAIDKGCRKIIIGIGGSATNDGGIGMAAALGVRFARNDGSSVPLTGSGLESIENIDISGRYKLLDECEILVACDVDSPLYGADGAAYIFAPQKGADEQMVKYLDSNLRHFAGILLKDLRINVQDLPGSGAAGGLGAGLAAFTGAKLISGIKIVLDTVNFNELIKDADLVITGEGRIDSQSMHGKVISGVAEEARRRNVPVIAIAGDIGDDYHSIYSKGISAVFSINRRAIPFGQARKRCKSDLKATAEDILRFASVIPNR